jgi:hypothetical protein
MSAIIPKTFDEWRQCIEHDCGLPLTQEFIQKRLTVFRQPRHEETLRFIHHYGETHLKRIMDWYQHAFNELFK